MKYILIFLLVPILFSCSPAKWVVQECRLELKKGKVKITRTGAARPIGDTVIICQMVRQK